MAGGLLYARVNKGLDPGQKGTKGLTNIQEGCLLFASCKLACCLSDAPDVQFCTYSTERAAGRKPATSALRIDLVCELRGLVSGKGEDSCPLGLFFADMLEGSFAVGQH